jgi:hypothetical protein
MTKDKADGKLMGGRIQESRIRKRGWTWRRGRILFGGEKEKP